HELRLRLPGLESDPPLRPEDPLLPPRAGRLADNAEQASCDRARPPAPAARPRGPRPPPRPQPVDPGGARAGDPLRAGRGAGAARLGRGLHGAEDASPDAPQGAQAVRRGPRLRRRRARDRTGDGARDLPLLRLGVVLAALGREADAGGRPAPAPDRPRRRPRARRGAPRPGARACGAAAWPRRLTSP